MTCAAIQSTMKLVIAMFTLCSGTHYGNPLKGACLPGESVLNTVYPSGIWCAKECNWLHSCPGDVPAGVTAKPQCVFRDLNKKWCVLSCTEDSQCGSAFCMKPLGENYSICEYKYDATSAVRAAATQQAIVVNSEEVAPGAGDAQTVKSVGQLRSALADITVERIMLASGIYSLWSELVITRSVSLEALVPGTVVLKGSSSLLLKCRVFNIAISSQSSHDVQLIGLNITNGAVKSNSFEKSGQGGGIYVDSGTVTFKRCNIYSNKAQYGGGMFIYGGNVTLTDSNIYSNSGAGGGNTWGGGGIFMGWPIIPGPVLVDASLTLTNCSVYDNSAANIDYAGAGGALMLLGGLTTLENTKVYNNHAWLGGGIGLQGTIPGWPQSNKSRLMLRLIDSRVSDNDVHCNDVTGFGRDVDFQQATVCLQNTVADIGSKTNVKNASWDIGFLGTVKNCSELQEESLVEVVVV